MAMNDRNGSDRTDGVELAALQRLGWGATSFAAIGVGWEGNPATRVAFVSDEPERFVGGHQVRVSGASVDHGANGS